MKIYDNVTQLIGRTPLMEVKNLEKPEIFPSYFPKHRV